MLAHLNYNNISIATYKCKISLKFMLENGECINRSLNILYSEIKQIFNVIFHEKIQLNKKINAK